MYGGIRRLLFTLEAETAHELVSWQLQRIQTIPPLLNALRTFAAPHYRGGARRLWGLTFDNPLGIAAGFDKNAVMIPALEALGFGFIEVGTVTLHPQNGNPRPRLFRVSGRRALINRLGFNNDGARIVGDRLRARVERRGTVVEHRPLLVNVGKNRDVPARDAAASYAACYRLVAPWAEGAVLNVSSPNTPNLRELQRPDHLREILEAIREERAALSFETKGAHPVLVKIAPDLSDGDLLEIGQVCRELADGMIATNTTVDQSGLDPLERTAGGLSGAPLFERSTAVLRRLRQHLGNEYPLIGVGGIVDGQTWRAKLEAGADLVQAYTGFVYGGPRFVRRTLEQGGGD